MGRALLLPSPPLVSHPTGVLQRPHVGPHAAECRQVVWLPLVATEDEYDARKISWGWVLAWTGLGVLLLCAAGVLQGLWDWSGVSIDILVHVGGTLLLAPLLPFLERSLSRRVVQANARMVQQETANLRQQVDSMVTRIDQLQGIVEQQDAQTAGPRSRYRGAEQRGVLHERGQGDDRRQCARSSS